MGSRAGKRPRLWQWPSLMMMELGNGVRLGLLQASLGTTLEHYAGIDVSLESASLCVVDATGRIVREAKVVSEPEILIGWFHGLELAMTRIAGALQVTAGTGDTSVADGAQAAADQEP